jgi:nickel-dependent lactate racemase
VESKEVEERSEGSHHTDLNEYLSIKNMVIGCGSGKKTLCEKEVYALANKAFSRLSPEGKRILVIIPDHTRTCPAGLFFRMFFDILADKVKKLDYLIALGTHRPLTLEKILARVEITPKVYKGKYKKVNFYNHLWEKEDTFKTIGTIPASRIKEITGGLFGEDVIIKINKLIFEYDLVVILGPTYPHEVVGFSGGNKYLFPGIAGKEIINFFHWLGAVITNPVINGVKDTPVRRIIDEAASFVKTPLLSFNLVVKDEKLKGLFIGKPKEAFDKAADLSGKLHIIYKDRPFKKVLGAAPLMYDDLWVAGKVMYKLEPVVADGGELIIYAPHINEVSYSHGEVIDKIGYHVRDYYLKQWDKFKGFPRGVVAHSTHVRGTGTFENGVEKPRIKVTLATGIPEKRCKKINLSYLNPSSININEWKGKEDRGLLLVPHAGEILYRLKSG